MTKLSEKWGKEVEIKSTGQHAGKSVAQLKKEIANLRGKPGNKEKMGELLFALRAKQGWKKKTGIAKHEGRSMLTLEKINLSENELDSLLNYIFEIEKPDEAEMYKKFIKEDATLDQKLDLLKIENIKTSLDLATKLTKLQYRRCVATCNEGKIWERQRNLAQCMVNEAKYMLRISEGDENLVTEWTNKLKNAQKKVLEYDNKFLTK